MLIKPKNKKGQVVNQLVFGIAGLIIGVIVSLVIVQTLTDASLLTSGSEAANATDRLSANFTAGIDEVSAKIPTVLLVAVIVLILGVFAMLVAAYKRMNMGGGGI